MEKRVKRTRSPAADNLILTQPEQEADADNVLASLSVLAFSDPGEELVVTSEEKPSGYKSRFFFRPKPSFTQEVEERKKTFKPRAIDHIDSVVTDRLKVYKKDMPDVLVSNIETVREFFLNEIAPLTLASTAGTSQAQDVVQRLVGGPIDGAVFDRYDKMLKTAVNIAMARFIARFVGLPRSAAEALLAELAPKAHPTLVPIPPASPNSMAQGKETLTRMQRIREEQNNRKQRNENQNKDQEFYPE